MAKVKDYYDVLGVSRSASVKDIQGAFRKLARKHHPDLNQGDKEAEKRFKEISEAHEVLADPEKRKLYDRFGQDWQAARAAGADGSQPRPGQGWSGATRTMSPDEMRDLFGDGEGFGDILGSIFGRGRRGPGPRAEVEVAVTISLREAYSGTSRTVELPGGRRIEVKVPAGIAAGSVLKVPGMLARVEIAPDPTFDRDGKDLRTAVNVPLRTALLGGEVDVPTLKGGMVKLKVAAGTQNGTRLRLRGLGMPDARGGGGQAGDLYAEVRVRLPLPLDEQTRRWAEEMPGQ